MRKYATDWWTFRLPDLSRATKGSDPSSIWDSMRRSSTLCPAFRHCASLCVATPAPLASTLHSGGLRQNLAPCEIVRCFGQRWNVQSSGVEAHQAERCPHDHQPAKSQTSPYVTGSVRQVFGARQLRALERCTTVSPLQPAALESRFRCRTESGHVTETSSTAAFSGRLCFVQ